MKGIIEISAYGVEWAVIAAKSGAGRIQLCDNISEGGTTPSLGMLKETLRNVKIPVLSMIRPRGGDFNYSEKEFESMKEDIRLAKECGAQGVVFGIHDKNFEFDIKRNRQLLELARPMEVCCHRAFDICPDPENALLRLMEIGFDRVTTSGKKLKAAEGIELLKKLFQLAKDKITVMPAAGIDSFNIKRISDHTGAKEFHLSSKRVNWEEPINNPGEISFSAPGTRLFMIDDQKVKDVVEKFQQL